MEQIGLACIPSVKRNFDKTVDGAKETYPYNAGNWNLAFLYGWGFEFSKGHAKKFYIGIQYLKAFGNHGSKTLNTAEARMDFSSRASSLSLSVGISFPI